MMVNDDFALNTGFASTNLQKQIKQGHLAGTCEPNDVLLDGDENFEFKDRDDDSQNREGCSQDSDGVYTTSKYVPKYEDNPWGYGPWRDVSRYFIMDDVNIPEEIQSIPQP